MSARDSHWRATHTTSHDAPWSLDQALTFIRTLLPDVLKCGFYLGLTGSVLISGESKHDLDVILYPMRSVPLPDFEPVREVLRSHGMQLLVDKETIHHAWRRAKSLDEKHVEVWASSEGKRVDLFWLK